MTSRITQAIKKINPNAEIVLRGNNIDNIEWVNGTTPISKADIEAKMAELPAIEEQVLHQMEVMLLLHQI